MFLASLAKKTHNYRFKMKHGAHSQNQSIIPKPCENLFKILRNNKTDLSLKVPSSGIGFAIL